MSTRCCPIMRGRSTTNCRSRRGRRPTLRKCERPIFISTAILGAPAAASTISTKVLLMQRAWECPATARSMGMTATVIDDPDWD